MNNSTHSLCLILIRYWWRRSKKDWCVVKLYCDDLEFTFRKQRLASIILWWLTRMVAVYVLLIFSAMGTHLFYQDISGNPTTSKFSIRTSSFQVDHATNSTSRYTCTCILCSIILTNDHLSLTIWFKCAQNTTIWSSLVANTLCQIVNLFVNLFFQPKKKSVGKKNEYNHNKRTSKKPYHLY